MLFNPSSLITYEKSSYKVDWVHLFMSDKICIVILSSPYHSLRLHWFQYGRRQTTSILTLFLSDKS